MLSLIDQWVERLLSGETNHSKPEAALDQGLQIHRSHKRKLTNDQAGQDFVGSDAFVRVINELDEEGLTGFADELCADALLVHPNNSNKNLFGHRLLQRGRRKEAEGIFVQLIQDETFAHGALKNLAQIKERDNDLAEACLYAERALAWDFQDQDLFHSKQFWLLSH